MISAISSNVPVPPGESDKDIAHLNHFILALRHILCDDQLCQPVILETFVHKELRFYTGHIRPPASRTLLAISPIKPVFDPP